MRALTRGCLGRMVGLAQAQRGTVIDRWQAAPEQDLALQV